MYISPRTKIFAHLDRLAGWQAGLKPAPITVEWDLSNRCALGCVDCHFAHTHTRGPWAGKAVLPMAGAPCGDLADFEVVRRGLAEMKQEGVRGMVWSGGGEPTLHPHWRDVVIYAHRLGFDQGMYTFGGLLDAESASLLANTLQWVVVSLDAADPDTYAKEKRVQPKWFHDVCAGIRLLSGRRATVGVSFLLHEHNWGHSKDMVALAKSLGASYTTFRPAIHTHADRPAVCSDDRSWITEAVPLLRELAEDPQVEVDVERFEEYRDWSGRSYHTCYGIRLTTMITPDGRVWLCPQHRGFANSCLGDLSKESFSAVWARHIGSWTDFSSCRVMCRLHLMNETLATVFESHQHKSFL